MDENDLIIGRDRHDECTGWHVNDVVLSGRAIGQNDVALAYCVPRTSEGCLGVNGCNR